MVLPVFSHILTPFSDTDPTLLPYFSPFLQRSGIGMRRSLAPQLKRIKARQSVSLRSNNTVKEGGVIFGFTVSAIFKVGFLVSAPKNFGFSVLVSVAVGGFSERGLVSLPVKERPNFCIKTR